MADDTLFSTVEPEYFMLMNGNQLYTGHTFLDADVILYIDGVIYSVDAGEIGLECSEVGGGWYKWQPVSVNQKNGHKLKLSIKDSSGGNSFDSGGEMFMTAGDANAFKGHTP